jgi:hyperosmotically inducible protein
MKVQSILEFDRRERKMRQNYFALSFIFLLGLAVLATGCPPKTIYEVVMDERSVGDLTKDKEIEVKVKTAFVDDETVEALDISVYSFYGDVYLVGQKETEAQEKRAVEIAKKTEAVKSVTTYILQKKGEDEDSCGTTNSLEITAKVSAALIGDEDIWSTNVEVQTVQCNVVLLGLVGSEEEIEKSIVHAKGAEGVRSVKSFLVSVKARK